MRIIGLDVGTKTIGVAVSDPLGYTAQGLKTIKRGELDNDIAELTSLVEEYDAETIVIGLPLNMNGSKGPSAAMAEDLAAILGEHTSAEIILRDERLTTLMAEKVMISGDVSRKKRKQVIDKMAAVLILQNYLDYIS